VVIAMNDATYTKYFTVSGFPMSVDGAYNYLQYGPLQKPRSSLVRNLVRALVSAILDPAEKNKLRFKRCIGLAAVKRMHPEQVDSALLEKLSNTIRALQDDDLHLGAFFLRLIPDSWQYVMPDVQERIKNFIKRMPIAEYPRTIARALDTPGMADAATERVATLDYDDLKAVINISPHPLIVDRAIEVYSEVKSFDKANECAVNIIKPLIPSFTRPQAERMIDLIAENSQIVSSFMLPSIKTTLDEAGIITLSEIDLRLSGDQFQVDIEPQPPVVSSSPPLQ